LPHPYKTYSGLPQQPPADVIAYGGAIAVHLWRTISNNPPALRIRCAKAYGFWALPHNDAPRVAPYFSSNDLVYKREKGAISVLSHRLALVDMLERVSVAQGDSPERRRERIFFRPAFTLRPQNESLAKSYARDYFGPAGKCGAGMVTWA
jgi:hypothetical protein